MIVSASQGISARGFSRGGCLNRQQCKRRCGAELQRKRLRHEELLEGKRAALRRQRLVNQVYVGQFGDPAPPQVIASKYVDGCSLLLCCLCSLLFKLKQEETERTEKNQWRLIRTASGVSSYRRCLN